MFLNNLLRRIVVSVPGRDLFGHYRFVPFFFFMGVGLEYVMIKWTPKGANFYTTFNKNQIEKAAQTQVHYEDIRDFVMGEQEKKQSEDK